MVGGSSANLDSIASAQDPPQTEALSGFDPNVKGKSVLEQSAFVSQLAEKFLTDADKEIMANLTVEQQLNYSYHYLIQAFTSLLSLKRAFQEKEEAALRMEAECAELKKHLGNMVNLCYKVNQEKDSAEERALKKVKLDSELEKLKRQWKELELKNVQLTQEIAKLTAEAESKQKMLESSLKNHEAEKTELSQKIEALENQNASLREEAASITSEAVKRFKKSQLGKEWELRGGMGYFKLAVNLMKSLLPQLGMIKRDQVANFRGLNIVSEIQSSPALKNLFEEGVQKIAAEISSDGSDNEAEDLRWKLKWKRVQEL